MIEVEFRLELHQFHLTAAMKDGGMILLSGENGSGKTSFLKCLAGLHDIGEGSIRINGREISALDVQRRRIVYVTQNSYFAHLEVDRHISWPVRDDPDPGFVEELKETFGIDYRGRLRDLSMGQKMRVTLATAFASRPDVILLDEVISNVSNPEAVLEKVRDLAHRNSVDVVFVAHSLGGGIADHHYSMRAGVMEKTS